MNIHRVLRRRSIYFVELKNFLKKLIFVHGFPDRRISEPDHHVPETWELMSQSTLGQNLPRLRLDLGLQESILKFLKVSHPSPTESEGVALENFLLESPKLGMGTK